jgi:enoyl reductase
MARAVVYTENGGPEVLRLVEIADATPAAGEVRVAVRAAGVNPIDWKLRAGLRGAGTGGVEQRVGSDAAGVVDAVGEGVQGVAVGDEVIVRDARGAYATHVIARAAQLTPKPSGLSWEQAASIGIPVGTAYQALRSLDVGEGDTLLLHGGAGGVGQAAIQFARAAGANVIATASQGNHSRIRSLGATPVQYGDGLVGRIAELAPEGPTVALDAVGTDEAIEASLQLVADRNRVGTVVRGADAAGWGIRAWGGGSPVPLTDAEKEWRREATALAAGLAARGAFEIEVSGRFGLDEAADAHRLSEAGHVRGKIVIVI